MDILTQWQLGYCAGALMSDDFRKRASMVFQNYYDKIKASKKYLEVIKCIPKRIYRVLSEPFDIKKVKKDFYYSFSGSIRGVLEIVKKDKYLRSNITLVIATPVQALNYNLLCGKSELYGAEDEIVSKINNNILDIKSFNTIQQLENYFKQAP